jgi:hypothetical protein
MQGACHKMGYSCQQPLQKGQLQGGASKRLAVLGQDRPHSA